MTDHKGLLNVRRENALKYKAKCQYFLKGDDFSCHKTEEVPK
jgi:hypothetical protein